MRKVEEILSGLMLALTGLLLAAGALLGAVRPEHLSYAAALAAGLLAAALWLLRQRKRAPRPATARLSDRQLCAVLALLCLALHLGGVLLLRLEPENDYATFYITAEDLARSGALQSGVYVALFPHILGYAWALSLVFRLFGASPLVAAVFNALLTTASGVLIFRLCLRWRGRETAALAFLFWILCPSKLLYNAMVLSEPWYSFLLLLILTLLAAVEARASATGRDLLVFALGGLAAGLLLCLFNAARPVGAIVIIALLIWLPMLSGQLRQGWRRCCAWGLFLALLLLGYGAAGRLWNGWAERVLGEAPASIPGYNLYVGFNPVSGGSYATEDVELLKHYRLEVYDSAEETQQQMLQDARARIRSGEIHFANLFRRKLRTFLGNDEGGVFYAQAGLSDRAYSLWALASNTYYYALIALVLAALPRVRRESRGRSLLLVPLYVLGLILAQMLVEVSGRYHYSLIPMLVILASFTRGKMQSTERGAKP